MSLRDQLLKAGLVDKGKVREANRDLKRQRRQEQAHRDRKAAVEAREAAAREEARVADVQRRRAERAAREAEREEATRLRLVDNLVGAWRLPDRTGPQPFFTWTPDRRHAHRLRLPESVAWDLRRGSLAVAWTGRPDDPQYALLPAATARRVLAHAPERIVFFNEAPPPGDDPALDLAPIDDRA